MLIYLFTLNWLFSMIVMFLNHPLSLGCILLVQTILISLASGFIYFNFWFSYILFLIMIGGMLVMFIYMTSIASNEKFKLPKKMSIFLLMFMLIMFITMIYMDNFYSNLITSSFTSLNQTMSTTNFNLSKYFNLPYMKILMSLMIYLLITLIAIVKIVGKNFGTLRQK